MDMSEDRKECHMCENFNKCNENVSYESNYCNAHRKQKCDKSVANIEKDINKIIEREVGRVKRHASGYWYQFIIPRRLTLPPVRIYRWLNFYWRLKDKEALR